MLCYDKSVKKLPQHILQKENETLHARPDQLRCANSGLLCPTCVLVTSHCVGA